MYYDYKLVLRHNNQSILSIHAIFPWYIRIIKYRTGEVLIC